MRGPREAPLRMRMDSAVAARATAQKVKPTGKKKYRGAVNPRLRALLNAKEYRKLISLLASLQEQGLLGEFLQNAEAYWREINVFELAMKEREGGQGVLGQVKRDWGKLWPAAMDGQRMLAFNTFQAFWGRLDRSKLIEDVMKTVLPDMEKDFRDQLDSSDVVKLRALSDEERSLEVIRRMGQNDIIVQFTALSEYDQEIKSIGPQMAPFIAKAISVLERKVATQTESLGKTADLAIAGGVAVVLLILLFVTGIVKLPDPTWSDLKIG